MNACVFDVLVENLEQVKITDFGLAKVLEHNQEQIYGGGGKVMFSRGWCCKNRAIASVIKRAADISRGCVVRSLGCD